MDSRGKIQHRERMRQLISFDGLRYDNSTPTDVDGLLEWRNRAFIFYEFKMRGVEMPRGQRVALERVVDALGMANKSAVLFLCLHDVENPYDDVPAPDAEVDKVYYKGKWRDGHLWPMRYWTDSFMVNVVGYKPDTDKEQRHGTV